MRPALLVSSRSPLWGSSPGPPAGSEDDSAFHLVREGQSGAARLSRPSASAERGAGAGSSDPILIARHARIDATGETAQLSDGLGGDHLDPVLETKDDQLLAGLEAQGLPDVSRNHDLASSVGRTAPLSLANAALLETTQ